MGKYNEKENDDYLLKYNLLGIDSREELERAEALAFSLRAMALEQNDFIFGSFTLKEFHDLHYYLFQDIYPFAGKFRDVQLMKGATRFCQVQFLNSYASDLFMELNEEPLWNSLNEAADRLAYFKTELNMLHPFREGNGRTIRIFLYAYAMDRGIEWAYETLEREKYIQAMIQSVTDLKLLKELFLETIQYIGEYNGH
ncbi:MULTISPECIES: Fic/DOC family protein [Sporosarcina]|uniref:Fic/DOC family protein n=1 Tax=Sporosarcina TaxID=1569 RepID=UPI00129AFAD0|nr:MULTISPECIES: Fic family protein [Sporosarcina]GKV67483.1 Fic family protein [Sporosarcina sp. NCCP-2331]GLB57848.1 Fic family protein [Sporosarcina sp. NCCP-2378]